MVVSIGSRGSHIPDMTLRHLLLIFNERGAQKGLRGKVKPMRIAQHGIATIVTQQWQIAGMVSGHSSFLAGMVKNHDWQLNQSDDRIL